VWKLVAGLATLIGVVTGIGTIVGWIGSSESFGDVADTAVGWAGLTYFAASAVGVFVAAALPERRLREGFADTKLAKSPAWIQRLVLVVGGVAFALVLAAEEFDPDNYVGFGYAILAVVAFIAVIVGVQLVAKARASRHSCPDCAETVRKTARVCPYCGYRFKPPLEGSRR
jgi:hypothetical protein